MSNVANPSRPMNEGSDKGQDKNAASMAAAVTEKANEAGTFLADKPTKLASMLPTVPRTLPHRRCIRPTMPRRMSAIAPMTLARLLVAASSRQLTACVPLLRKKAA